MGKKAINLSIDEDVLDVAKRKIPNLSEFVEGALRTALDMVKPEDIERVIKMENIAHEIRKLKVEWYALQKTPQQLEDEKIEYENKQKNIAWNRMFHYIKKDLTVPDDILTNAVEVLQKSEKELLELGEDIYLSFPPNDKEIEKYSKWNNALNWEDK